MASTYTPRLRIEKQGVGENSTTWGSKISTALDQCVEEAIAGIASVTATDAGYTLTSSNGTTDEARRAIIHLTGTITANRNVFCPAVEKIYMVSNATTGGYSIIFACTGGIASVTVPNGTRVLCYCNGSGVYDLMTYTSVAADYLAKAGGTMTGQLVVPEDGSSSSNDPITLGFRGGPVDTFAGASVSYTRADIGHTYVLSHATPTLTISSSGVGGTGFLVVLTDASAVCTVSGVTFVGTTTLTASVSRIWEIVRLTDGSGIHVAIPLKARAS